MKVRHHFTKHHGHNRGDEINVNDLWFSDRQIKALMNEGQFASSTRVWLKS